MKRGGLAANPATGTVLTLAADGAVTRIELRTVFPTMELREEPGAKKALAEIWNAEDKDHAQAAANVFAADDSQKPKARMYLTEAGPPLPQGP